MRSISFFYQNNTSVAREKKEQIPLFSSQRPRQHERGLAMRSYIGKGKLWFILEQWLNSCRALHPGTRPGRHSSNCYGPPTKLKVMVGVVEMKVKVEGGITKMNVNGLGGMRVR